MREIFDRVSVRSYTHEPVTDEQLECLLRAAMAAPSAGNQQPWEFYVVRDPDVLAFLGESTPYSKPTGKAPCCIVPCITLEGRRFPGCAAQDLAAATENILLEAVHLGLGCCWQAVSPEADRIANVRSILRIPEGLEPFCLISVGHPQGEVSPKCAERYDPARVRWVG